MKGKIVLFIVSVILKIYVIKTSATAAATTDTHASTATAAATTDTHASTTTTAADTHATTTTTTTTTTTAAAATDTHATTTTAAAAATTTDTHATTTTDTHATTTTTDSHSTVDLFAIPADPPLDYSEHSWPSQCTSGHKQSPIDFPEESVFYKKYDDGNTEDYYLEIISYNYPKISGIAFSNYHNSKFTANVTSLGGSIIIRKAGVNYSYILEEINFHYVSEHSFNGNSTDLEMQLVHKKDEHYLSDHGHSVDPDESNNKLIISVLFKEDPKALNINVARMNIATLHSIDTLDLSFYTLHTRNFYHYEGSITQPDCTENVNWIVMEKIEYLSSAQLNDFKKWIGAVYPHYNSRIVKPLNKRTVYHIVNSNNALYLGVSLMMIIFNMIFILL